MSHVKARVFLICSVLVMLRHVLHVTKANPALAGVQLFLLTSTENVLYGNSCCGAELKHDLMQNLCSSVQVGGTVSQSEHSWSRAPALFMLTSISVAAFDFCHAFHDPMWQNSPKLIRICVDSCFKSVWPLSVIFFISFSCEQGVGCRLSSISFDVWCFPMEFWPLVLGGLFLAFFCKLTAARIISCLLQKCDYWVMKREVSSGGFHQWRLYLVLFLNLTCA